MSNFSKRLKTERTRLKIKSKELASVAGIHPTRQSSYENNGLPEFGDYLGKIAALGFDLNYIFTGMRGEIYLTSEEMEFLALLRKASPEVRETACEILRSGTVITKQVHVGRDNFGNIKL